MTNIIFGNLKLIATFVPEMARKLFVFFLFVIMLSFASEAMAQGCPMCKTSLEEARKNGSQVGSTLNNGILYLLALPYLIAATFGIIWYRNVKIKKKQSLQTVN